jgi:hypothetical protein
LTASCVYFDIEVTYGAFVVNKINTYVEIDIWNLDIQYVSESPSFQNNFGCYSA